MASPTPDSLNSSAEDPSPGRSTLPPAKLREARLLILFAQLEKSQENDELIKLVKRELEIASSHARVAAQEAGEILKETSRLASRLERLCTGYSWSRIGELERAILLLGAWELDQGRVPTKVVLAEATRLAKKFIGLEASAFVNALLDAYHHQIPLDAEVGYPLEQPPQPLEGAYELILDSEEE